MGAYIKPELLNGNNKYRCENCDSLEDAEKGLAIKVIFHHSFTLHFYLGVSSDFGHPIETIRFRL
jgi:hypothetical protein